MAATAPAPQPYTPLIRPAARRHGGHGHQGRGGDDGGEDREAAAAEVHPEPVVHPPQGAQEEADGAEQAERGGHPLAGGQTVGVGPRAVLLADAFLGDGARVRGGLAEEFTGRAAFLADGLVGLGEHLVGEPGGRVVAEDEPQLHGGGPVLVVLAVPARRVRTRLTHGRSPRARAPCRQRARRGPRRRR
ncbi:hypothetical protein RB200_12245 [Streptomyces sp. PmtG]